MDEQTLRACSVPEAQELTPRTRRAVIGPRLCLLIRSTCPVSKVAFCLCLAQSLSGAGMRQRLQAPDDYFSCLSPVPMQSLKA